MRWLKNSGGKPDAMFTLAVLSWIVTVFCLVAPVLSGFQVPWTQYVLNITPPDTALVVAFMGATFTSYVVRRNKKDQLDFEEIQNGGD